MMYRYFFILMNCMCIFRASAQTENTGVSGRVLEIEGTPVESATILLLQANDSSYVSGTVTDREGLYLFERVAWGDYLLKVMMLGYHPQYIPIHYTGKVPHELPVTYLKEDAVLLTGVTVTADRYQVKLEPGKTIIQFSDRMTGTGGSVLEILRSLPGVLIQEDGSVMLNGQSGTKILVDGKETHLSGENLANLLRSMAASSVNDVELLTHPPAKWDASGTGGMIDIRTKKNHRQGFTLAPDVSLKQGKYTRGNGSIGLGYRKDRINLYGNYSYNRGTDYVDLEIQKEFLDPWTSEPLGSFSDQYSYRKFKYHSHFCKAGMDYEVSNLWTASLYATGHFYHRDLSGTMETRFYKMAPQTDSILYTNNHYLTSQKNFTSGVSLDYHLPGKGEWSSSFDYLSFNRSEDQLQRNLFHHKLDDQFRRNTIGGDMGEDIRMYSGQSNIRYLLSERLTLSAGGKTTWIHMDNKAIYRSPGEDGWIRNEELSNHFIYKENIHAGYFQADWKITDHLLVETGLRVENTRVDGELAGNIKADSAFRQRYTGLYPTLLVKYQLPHANSVALMYRRRIIRPNYRDMNPFIYMFDDYAYEQGNTDLKPELSENLELFFGLKNHYSATFLFQYVKDPILKNFRSDENKRMWIFPDNLSSHINAGFRLGTSNLSFRPWWSFSGNLTGMHRHYEWKNGEVTEKDRRFTTFIDMNNRFVFPKGWSAELRGNYRSKLVAGQAIMRACWFMDGGIRKSLWDGKAAVTLFVDDIFSTRHADIALIKGLGQQGRTAEYAGAFAVGITFSWRFTKGSETKDSRSKGGIDESKRLNL